MKRLRDLTVAAAIIVCALQPRLAEAQGPSTPEGRARFVARVRSLEREPLDKNANSTRQQLRQWAIEVPDIRFQVCDDLLGHAFGNDYPYSSELTLQVFLSGAAFTIEHPGDARDGAAVYTAGVEGALRAYEGLVKSAPDARRAALDDLIEKRGRDELADHVAGLTKDNCKRSNAPLIATPIGAAVGLMLALLVARWFGSRGARPAHGQRELTMTAATTSRTIVLLCAAYYVAVGVALHFLEPEYDPRFQFMSDYAWGAYGRLMTTTFFILGFAIVTVAVGLRNVQQPSPGVRVGFGLLVVGALAVCMAGVFRGFPLHDVAGAVAFPSLVMAVLLLSSTFRKQPGWQPIHAGTLLIGVGMFAALVSMIVDVGMPGLQQRAFLLLLLLWLSIVIHRLVRVTACRNDD